MFSDGIVKDRQTETASITAYHANRHHSPGTSQKTVKTVKTGHCRFTVERSSAFRPLAGIKDDE